jgi:rhodanese-related sulfurtransferase
MSSFTTITPEKLARLIGTPNSAALIDVRTEEDFAADARLIPGALKRTAEAVDDWGKEFVGRSAIVICGPAAGVRAETLEGGFEGWKTRKLPLVSAARRPRRDTLGRTVWVTRARPKIGRIACPWLIRRFADQNAVFLFVIPSEVIPVGETFDATPFDIETCSGATAASAAPLTSWSMAMVNVLWRICRAFPSRTAGGRTLSLA